MTIREARQSDLRAIAEVLAAAFMDEELFGNLMHPYRKEYPEDFIVFFQRRCLSHWFEPNHYFLVGLDKVSGKVVAFVEWERQGSSMSWSSYLVSGKPISVMVSYYNRASSYIWPNRAADPTKTHVMEESFPFFSNLFSGSRARNWSLNILATHPDFQRQGIGRELVQWGIKEADKENICSSVISAFGKEEFYGKSGFIEVGRANVGPLKKNGIEGGAVMFREVDGVSVFEE